jgi:HD superfamily phosphohydrolase
MRGKAKHFQDPVYGQISVSSPLLISLIDSRAVQRLKHIRQLGVAFFTFLGADHSRFSHSLGCMHLMNEVLEHLGREEGLRLSPEAREGAQAAALLHDIGHCAFSHTLEGALGHQHEDMTARLMREDPQLRKLLGRGGRGLAGLFSGATQDGGQKLSVVKDLVSSQLDVDRLDYLVRDAHYTGVNSGKVDLSRIIGSFTVKQGRLMVKEKALLAVEEYFLARYFMYWKVYFHKTSRGLELVLKGLIRRAKELHAKSLLDPSSLSPALKAFFEQGNRVGTQDFLDHDDSDVMVGIKRWQYGEDPVLSELSRRFLNRQKFKMVWEARSLDEQLNPKKRQRLREYFERLHPGSADYFFIEDSIGTLPYDASQPVWLLNEDGRRENLALRSKMIRDITQKLVHARYYVPSEHAAVVLKMIKG